MRAGWQGLGAQEEEPNLPAAWQGCHRHLHSSTDKQLREAQRLPHSHTARTRQSQDCARVSGSTAPWCGLRTLFSSHPYHEGGTPGPEDPPLGEHLFHLHCIDGQINPEGTAPTHKITVGTRAQPAPSVCAYSLRVWGRALTSFTSGSLSGRCTSTRTKCWFVPVCSGRPVGEGGGRQPPATVASAVGLFRCGGDWTRGKGPMGCWFTRARWASSGLLAPGLAGETEA